MNDILNDIAKSIARIEAALCLSVKSDNRFYHVITSGHVECKLCGSTADRGFDVTHEDICPLAKL